MKFHRNKSKLHIHRKNGKKYVTCFVRQASYLLTPEEEIRQMLLYHFIYEKNIPAADIWVEGKLSHVLTDAEHCGRFDILVLKDRMQGKNIIRDLSIIVECKRGNGNLGGAYNQVWEYNKNLGASYMIITNGKESCIFFINPRKSHIELLSDLPSYADILRCKSGGLEIGYLIDDKIVIY
jgi:hypothetical protein